VHQESLGSFLEREDGLRLPAELLAFRTAIEGYFTDLFLNGGPLVAAEVMSRRFRVGEFVPDEQKAVWP